MKTKAIGIIRVSRIRKDGAQSPEVQRRLIGPFAESQGWDLVDLLNENELRNGNVSGGADLSKRPGFGPAVERVRRGRASVILAADLSRLFRDIDIQRQVIAQIEAAGGEFWTVANGRVSHETPDSELMANGQGSMNHYQRRYAREKSFLAVEVAIEQGKVPWSQTAPGYVRSDDSTLQPDRALSPVIKRAFALRAEGATIDAVRTYFREHGIDRSYHGTQHLLRDRVYLGEVNFGTHTPNLAAHEPIVDRELFEAVQRTTVPRGRRAKSDRLLARLGVLRCGSCGSRMVVGTSNNSAYYIYRCPPVGDCPRRQTISAELAEREVVAWVKDAIAGLTGSASMESRVQDAQQALDAAQGAYASALRTFTAADAMDEPAAVERLSALRDERDRARERHEQALEADEALTLTVTVDDWDKFTLDERRNLIKATVARAVVNPGRGADRLVIEGR